MMAASRNGFVLTVCLAALAGCASDDASTQNDGAVTSAMPDAQTARADSGLLDAATMVDAAHAGSTGGDAATVQDGTTDASLGDAGTPGPHVDLSQPKLYEYALDPHVLDATTKDSLSTQYAQLDTRTQPLGKLVVFLPGANNTPSDWRDHGRKLAEFGFHVLIPHYNNRWSSDGTCDGKSNSCGDDTRWEALVGEDTSDAIAISRADSAEGRVITMLNYLAANQPGGDWGYYLSADGSLDYSRCVIAGISHGAASAGMYATRRPFTRNVMHSSGAAGSASATKMTPIEVWYGFAHQQDPAFGDITSSWSSFKIPGQPTNIDGQSAPFSNSHRLTTNATTTYPHGSVCVHSSSPKDASGHYLFEPAWRYLYGVAQK